MQQGIKHTIQCRCVMNQFKRQKRPPLHRFVVFSIMVDDVVTPKFVQCNNCGIIHKIIDLNRSEIISGREHMASIVSMDELRASLPEKLTMILDQNFCDQPTWEAASFIISNQRWGDFVVLSSDVEGDVRQGKFVRILGENLFKVESFARDEVIQ